MKQFAFLGWYVICTVMIFLLSYSGCFITCNTGMLIEQVTMSETLAEMFMSCDSLDSFRERVISREGEYPFAPEDMIALGNAYFRKYPEPRGKRNSAHTRIGYQVVMISIVEKLLQSVDRELKGPFRDMFYDVSGLEERVSSLVDCRGLDVVQSAFSIIEAHLEEIQESVNDLDRGHVKERFVGALTSLFNIVYIMKSSIARNAGQGSQP